MVLRGRRFDTELAAHPRHCLSQVKKEKGSGHPLWAQRLNAIGTAFLIGTALVSYIHSSAGIRYSVSSHLAYGPSILSLRRAALAPIGPALTSEAMLAALAEASGGANDVPDHTS